MSFLIRKKKKTRYNNNNNNSTTTNTNKSNNVKIKNEKQDNKKEISQLYSAIGDLQLYYKAYL